jgi:hypothetical protein
MINFSLRILPEIAWTLQPLTAPLKGNPEILTWLLTISSSFITAKAALVAAVPLSHSHMLPGAVLSLAKETSETHVGATSRKPLASLRFLQQPLA